MRSKALALCMVALMAMAAGACGEDEPGEADEAVEEITGDAEAELDVSTSLLEASTAMEVYFTEHAEYTDDIDAVLAAVEVEPATEITVGSVSADAFCLESTSGNFTGHFDSTVGDVEEGPC